MFPCSSNSVSKFFMQFSVTIGLDEFMDRIKVPTDPTGRSINFYKRVVFGNFDSFSGNL